MLPANLQSLQPDALIELFEISDYRRSNPAETFRFCNYNGVSYRVNPTATPQPYLAIACESEGFELVGQGPVPQPKITVSNVGRSISDLLFIMKTNPDYRLEGSTVIRRVTQSSFLEGGGNELAGLRELPFHSFVIEHIEQETFKAVQFTLSSPFDFDGATLPNRPALRTCAWRYRSEECGYFGAAKFTRRNQSTGDSALDVCNKSIAACELRFGEGAILRHGGFPGLGRN